MRHSLYSPRLPLGKAWLYILCSVLLICGPVAIALCYAMYIKINRSHDPKYHIVAIVQTCSNNEWLSSSYLAELMGLSTDQPTNLYRFNCKEAQKKLLKCPLIKSATVRKVKPGTIYIHYTLRQAVAYLGDYSNCAIDHEGVIIPFKPFFTPKNLPELTLGLNDNEANDIWGSKCPQQALLLALNLLRQIDELLADQTPMIKHIDLTNAWAPSRGEREIILNLDNRVLRLDISSYAHQINNYRLLRPHLVNETLVDLRISQLAFIAPLQ